MINLAAFIDEYDKTLEGQIEGLKKHNIKLIELRSVDGVNIADISLDDALRIQKKFDENDLKVWSIGSPIGKVDITCDFNEYLNTTVKHIFELAKIFKTERIRMFSFYKAYDNKELVFKYLNQMVELAKEYGVTLYHENEKEIYGDTIERVLEIKENCPGLKFIYDPANFIQCEQDPNESISKLFSMTSYFHIKDVDKETQELLPAGYGSADIRKLISLMDAFDFTLTLEPHLAMFEVFNVIDNNPMKHRFEFKNQKEAFDTAVNELKKLLNEAGYKEEESTFIKPRVRYGVVGLGNIGSQHIGDFFKRCLIKNATVTAIADTKESRIERILNLYPEQHFDIYHSAEELIEKADIDALLIAVPHYYHPSLVIKALKKNINVICEKPAGVYTKAVKEMNEVAKSSKSLFTMMFNQRTNCLYRKMREMILGGKIGEIKRINWIITNWYRPQSYYDSGDWRATWTGEGGGVLMNQCPHQLDLLQWTTGMMPKNVTAFVNFGKYHDIEVEDEVTAYFEYENGATGVFVTCTADAPGDNRFEVLGTKGKLIVENDELIYFENDEDERDFNKRFTGGFGSPKFTRTVVETDGINPQHSGIINNFAAAILGYEKLFVSGTEGLNGVELDNAMRLSGFLGSKKVTIPVDDELYLSELEKRRATSRRKVAQDIVIDTEHSYQG